MTPLLYTFSSLLLMLTIVDYVFMIKQLPQNIWKKFMLVLHGLVLWIMFLCQTGILFPHYLKGITSLLDVSSLLLCTILHLPIIMSCSFKRHIGITSSYVPLLTLTANCTIGIFISPIASLIITSALVQYCSRLQKIPVLKHFIRNVSYIPLLSVVFFMGLSLTYSVSELSSFLLLLILFTLNSLYLLLLRPFILIYNPHASTQRRFMVTSLTGISATALGIYFFLNQHVPAIHPHSLILFFFMMSGMAGISVIVLKMWDALVHNFRNKSLRNFQKRMLEIRPYLESIQDIQEYFTFVNSLMIETFSIRTMSIILFDHSFNTYVRIIQKGTDITHTSQFASRELKECIKEADTFIIEAPHLTTLQKYHIEETHFIRQNIASPFHCFIALLPGNDISEHHLAQIKLNLEPLSENMDYILNIEKQKSVLTRALKDEKHEEKIQILSREKKHLQSLIQNIRDMQSAILEKEKQIALTETSIRIDDEISNPLNNILVILQYHIEKIEKGKNLTSDQITGLFKNIETQSFRIKELLTQLNTQSTKRSGFTVG